MVNPKRYGGEMKAQVGTLAIRLAEDNEFKVVDYKKANSLVGASNFEKVERSLSVDERILYC